MSRVLIVRDDDGYKARKRLFAFAALEDIRAGKRSQLPMCGDCHAEVDVSDIENFELEVHDTGCEMIVPGIVCWFCCHDEDEPLSLADEDFQEEYEEYHDDKWTVTSGIHFGEL